MSSADGGPDSVFGTAPLPRAEASPWGMWISISALPISVWLQNERQLPQSTTACPQASGDRASIAPARSSASRIERLMAFLLPDSLVHKRHLARRPTPPAFTRHEAPGIFSP